MDFETTKQIVIMAVTLGVTAMVTVTVGVTAMMAVTPYVGESGALIGALLAFYAIGGPLIARN